MKISNAELAKIQNILYALSRIRGIERMNHFADGGTIEQWRGKMNVRPDKKKDANKKACRKAHKE